MGQTAAHKTFELKTKEIKPSIFDEYPNQYQILAISIFLSYDVTIATRKTYDLLGLAGDIGGLYEVVGWSGIILVTWFNHKHGTNVLANTLFKT